MLCSSVGSTRLVVEDSSSGDGVVVVFGVVSEHGDETFSLVCFGTVIWASDPGQSSEGEFGRVLEVEEDTEEEVGEDTEEPVAVLGAVDGGCFPGLLGANGSAFGSNGCSPALSEAGGCSESEEVSSLVGVPKMMS